MLRSVCFLFIASLFVPLGAHAELPKVSVSKPLFEFGTVDQGEIVTHDFELKNTGQSELVIQRIVSACGCTTTKPSGDTVPPGKSLPLQVSFDTSGFSGEKLKTVRVFTNDPKKPSTVLSLRGKIVPEVIVSPRRLSFGELIVQEEFESEERTIQVSIRENGDATIEEVVSRSPYVEFTEKEIAPNRWEIAVKLIGEIPVGEFRDRLVLRVKDASQSSLNIPIYASVRGPIRVTPRSVGFGLIDGDEPVTRELQLVNEAEEPLEVKSVKPSHRSLSAELKVVEEGRRYALLVTIDPSKLTRNLKSALRIKTDSESNEELTVSVTAAIPPQSLLKGGN